MKYNESLENDKPASVKELNIQSDFWMILSASELKDQHQQSIHLREITIDGVGCFTCLVILTSKNNLRIKTTCVSHRSERERERERERARIFYNVTLKKSNLLCFEMGISLSLRIIELFSV